MPVRADQGLLALLDVGDRERERALLERAQDDDPAAWGGQPLGQRSSRVLGATDRLDRHVDAIAVGPIEHGRLELGRIRSEHMVGTELTRLVQPVVEQVDDHDLGAVDLAEQHPAESDRPGAEDEYALALAYLPTLDHALVRDGKRLYEGALLGRHRRRQRVDLVGRHRDVLGHPAGQVLALTQDAVVGADVGEPGATEPAGAAADVRLDADQRADDAVRDAGADRDDRAGAFVTEDRRRLDVGVDAAVGTQVGAADRGGLGADDDLARARLGYVAGDDLDRARRRQQHGSHRPSAHQTLTW